MVLSLATLYAFGARIDTGSHMVVSDSDDVLQLSFKEFVARIFKFSDTCNDLELSNNPKLTDSLLNPINLSEVG